MEKNRLKGTVLVIISAMTFGSLPIFSKLAYIEGMSVSNLLFFRFLTASIILWLYVFIKRLTFKVSKDVFIRLILISLIGYTASASGLFYAYKYISSSLATIIIYCYPIIVVAYEMIELRRIDYKKTLCLITTSIGLILVVLTGSIKINWTGILLALISAVGYAYFCIGLNDKRIQKLNSIVISTYVMSSCAIFYFIQNIITHKPVTIVSSKSYIYIFIIGTLCSIVPTITLYEGIKKIGIGTSVIISTFEPIFVCIMGIVLFNERITLNMILGGTIIISSLIILQIPIENLFIKNKKPPVCP